MRPCLDDVSTALRGCECTILTLDGIPHSPVLVCWRIAWWPAFEPFHDQWVQVDHGEMIAVHIKHTLPCDASRQRRNSGEDSSLRHDRNLW